MNSESRRPRRGKVFIACLILAPAWWVLIAVYLHHQSRAGSEKVLLPPTAEEVREYYHYFLLPGGQGTLYLKAKLSRQDFDAFAKRVIPYRGSSAYDKTRQNEVMDMLAHGPNEPRWFDPPNLTESDSGLFALSDGDFRLLKYKEPYLYYFHRAKR